MTTPPPPPERQSRARAGLGGDVPEDPPSPAGPLPGVGTDRAVDMDQLRASAASAIDAEHAKPLATPAETADDIEDIDDGDDTDDVEHGENGEDPSARGSRHEAAAGTDGGLPPWLKIALPIGIVAALVTVGLALSGGDTEQSSGSTPPAAMDSNAAAPTTAVPGTSASTTAEPSREPATTAPDTAPATTVPPAAALPPDAAAPPAHKATYRAGKLYLEGRVASDTESQKYVAKAAAVLGADNVVNNYVIDPSVPPSTDGTIYVDEPFLFDTGSSSLNPAYTGVLGLGVAALKLSPDARMVVTGYTDNKGDPAKNQELSVARANAVVDYLVTIGGIDRSRLDAIGAGDRDPVGDNNTEEGRKLNRRIDVKLVNLLS